MNMGAESCNSSFVLQKKQDYVIFVFIAAFRKKHLFLHNFTIV